MARTIAITGGTGFIGRHLVARHVAQGDRVRYLTRRKAAEAIPGAEACIGDLAAPESLRSLVQGADVLYHCAAELHDVTEMEKTNVTGTANLLDAAAGEVGRWVQLSSAGLYGAVRNGEVREETEIRPNNPYECSKAAADALVLDAAERRGLSCVLLRPSNVFGAEMANQSLFAMISMIHRGMYFFIGDSGASANYIHVDNVVDALMLCGGKAEADGQLYNLSDHRTMEQFVSVIAESLGEPIPSLRVPEWPVRLAASLLGGMPAFPLTESRIDALTGRAVYSINKIEHELGYRHLVSMESGLKELAQSWQHRVAV